MGGFAASVEQAFGLVVGGDGMLWPIVVLGLQVSGLATLLAAAVALPLAAWIALTPFRGRGAIVALLNALMGLPSVVVGLAVYLLLSRAGPLGPLGLLFTPTAMIFAQAVLIAPILAALTREVLAGLWEEYAEQLRSFGASPRRAVPTLLWDGRVSLLTGVLAGFGRASAEVGAVLIVGGNIAGHTRTMTTAITLETNRGNLGLAVALGIILLALTLTLNAAAWGAGQWARGRLG